MTETTAKNIGLRGVTVADSKISRVDGVAGQLIYRGYQIEDLAHRATYEEVVYLLLMGRLPTRDELDEVCQIMQGSRPLPDEVLAGLKARKRDALPMSVLQGAIASLSDHDPDRDNLDRTSRVRSSLRLISRTASVVAAWHHLREGKEPPSMDTTLSHAGAFLKAIWNREPTQEETHLLDVILVIHAEHTFNASTFAVREVASTRALICASVAAGVGALSGPLHGGANSRVMDMLREIGDSSRVESWVRDRVSSGRRVMGLGHAVYQVEDPRARILRDVAVRALEGTPNEKWFQLALQVEETSRRVLKELKGMELYPNVDFFSGGVLSAIGIEDSLFPAMFAVARVAGWTAHLIEEEFAEAQPKPVLYRPRANYVGRDCGDQGCQFVPIENRGFGCPCGNPLNSCPEEMLLESIRERS